MNSAERLMPFSQEAERALLGAVLLDQEAFFQIIDSLLPLDFFREAHRVIFESFISLAEQKTPIDLTTVFHALKQGNALEKAGGAAYLADLTNGLPRGLNIRAYAKIIRDKSILRQLISITSETQSRCFEPGETSTAAIEKIISKLLKLSAGGVNSGFRPINDIACDGYRELMNRSERKLALNGVDSGFWDVNRYLGGLKPGNMIVVAARPSMGKTSLVLNIGCHAALRCGKTVGIFSLEMSGHEVYDRIVSAEATVDLSRISMGDIGRVNWQPITVKTDQLSKSKIWIDDSGSLTINQVRARAQSLNAVHGVDLLIVDYLQLIKGQRKGASRYEDVTEISRELKLLAKELSCPVIAVSQLSRSAEGERPQLSHLRESGAIEQDADIVLMIAQKRGEETSPEILVAKNRNGPTGSFRIGWDCHITKFTDYKPAGFSEI